MAAVKHYDHRERTNYHCYRLVNPRGLKQSLAEAYSALDSLVDYVH